MSNMKETIQKTMDKNPESQWFGEESVKPDQKTEKVIEVFDSVADKYDLMNDVMSMGIHRLWKNHFIRIIKPRAGLHYLDVAGGTGDIAFKIREKAGKNAQITLCDLNTEMLSVGRNRAIDKGYIDDFNWITGNAEALPIPDESIDIYTIAFGLRNVTRIDDALKDAYRVLRPGGRFFCLEFSHMEEATMQKLYDAYSYAFIPLMGEIITKDRDSYQYLVESIRKMPTQEELKKRIADAGFDRPNYENLSFGIASIHSGFKA